MKYFNSKYKKAQALNYNPHHYILQLIKIKKGILFKFLYKTQINLIIKESNNIKINNKNNREYRMLI